VIGNLFPRLAHLDGGCRVQGLVAALQGFPVDPAQVVFLLENQGVDEGLSGGIGHVALDRAAGDPEDAGSGADSAARDKVAHGFAGAGLFGQALWGGRHQGEP
jgi:hypothetical protein